MRPPPSAHLLTAHADHSLHADHSPHILTALAAVLAGSGELQLELEQLVERGRQEARRIANYNDHLLDTYHKPRHMAAAEALLREATWMRLAMSNVINGHASAPAEIMTVVDANPVKHEASFGLRVRPTKYDYVVHRRGVVFVNLGVGKNLKLLQEWGFECVPCQTEGCYGVTTPISTRELTVAQVGECTRTHNECAAPI